jgi:hypothetical protein
MKIIDTTPSYTYTRDASNIGFGTVFKGTIEGQSGVYLLSYAGPINLENAESYPFTSLNGKKCYVYGYQPVKAELHILHTIME